MDRVLSSELASHVGERVRVAGWLHHQRQLAKISFLLVRDRAGIAQVVAINDDVRTAVGELVAETVVEVIGEVIASDQAPSGVEIVDPEVMILSSPSELLPFELRRPELSAQLPTLLDHAAVALRHPRRRAVAALAAASVGGFRNTLDASGFTEIHTPKVVAAATESGANVFPIDWFGDRAFLAQSPQFYKQIMVGVFERVLRGRPRVPSRTPRHGSTLGSVPVAGCRDGLHRRPHRRHGDTAGRTRRHDGEHHRARRTLTRTAVARATGGSHGDPGDRLRGSSASDRVRHR